MQKKISSQEVYQGVIFTMTRDEVEIKGKRYPRDVIHHHGGVGVLAVQDDRVLLVRQYRHAIEAYSLEIPAGKLEKDEDPYTCGMRELEEESGYRAQRLEKLCAMYSTPGFCNEKIHIYRAEGLTKLLHPKAMDEDEEIEILWLPLREAMAMISDGRIQDAKTIIALQAALLSMEEKESSM